MKPESFANDIGAAQIWFFVTSRKYMLQREHSVSKSNNKKYFFTLLHKVFYVHCARYNAELRILKSMYFFA